MPCDQFNVEGMQEKKLLCQTTLDFGDGRDMPCIGEWVPSVDKKPPPRYRVAKISRGIVIDLPQELAGKSSTWQAVVPLTEPTSEAKMVLAPIEPMAATWTSRYPLDTEAKVNDKPPYR